MKDGMISIIVPAYNVEQYIAKCLESIQKQTCCDWEAIVVDDGSTDETGAICDQFALKDSRFHVFHRDNQGVCQARNFALSVANGRIIGFADADDFLFDYTFEVILNHFKDAEVDAVYAGHCRVDECDQLIETRAGVQIGEGESTEAVKYTLLEGKRSYLGVLWNKYFKRDCIFSGDRFVPFLPQYKIGEDQIWLLEVCKNIKKLETEPLPVYNYRERSGSAVHAPTFTETKRTELEARKQMVSIVEKDYPELSLLAKGKYRNCINASVLLAIKQKNLNIIKQIVPFARQYYIPIIKSKMPLKKKVKETALQIMYVFFR